MSVFDIPLLGLLWSSPEAVYPSPEATERDTHKSSILTRWINGHLRVSELRPPAEQAQWREFENTTKLLRQRLREASTYDEWRAAAIELDQLEGNDEWKEQPHSPEYNAGLVESRLQQLQDARARGDPNELLSLVRTSLTRHLGGIGNVRLYRHSHLGTKYMIDQYIDTALGVIEDLLEEVQKPRCSLDCRAVLEQVLQARQSFGRSALLLSGGGTLGMNHIGVAKSLWEAKLLPRIISGASAGSIVCAIICSTTDDEVPALLEEFCYGDLDVFTPPDGSETLVLQLKRLLKHGSLFDIANLTRVMKGLLGDITFQESYNRTRRILNICVSSAGVFELPRILNYITAPNVVVWSAVAASCSVPLIFSPATLLAKDPRSGQLVTWNSSENSCIDGSVDNDLPITRLSEMFNVNHFIVSQVNPHVVPFLAKDAKLPRDDDQGVESNAGQENNWLHTATALAKDEAMHRMHILSEFGILPTMLTKLRSVLSQTYSGDITIFPEAQFNQLSKILTNPTTEFMIQAMHIGERATWPKLSRVQNHCAIELALDDAVRQVRARVAFSPSQIDLRLQTFAQTPNRRTDAQHREGAKRSYSGEEIEPGGFELAKRDSAVGAPEPLSAFNSDPAAAKGEVLANVRHSNKDRPSLGASFQIAPASEDQSNDPSDDEMADFLSQASDNISDNLSYQEDFAQHPEDASLDLTEDPQGAENLESMKNLVLVDASQRASFCSDGDSLKRVHNSFGSTPSLEVNGAYASLPRSAMARPTRLSQQPGNPKRLQNQMALSPVLDTPTPPDSPRHF